MPSEAGPFRYRAGVNPGFDGREYVVRQKITPIANVYSVFAGHDGDAGMLAYVRQKRLKLKEEILFYSDKSREQLLLRVKARKVLDLGSRYDVTDGNGQRIGVIGKAFGASLTRSTWTVFDPSESVEVLRFTERNLAVALFRRIWNFIPYAGDLPFMIRYHFDGTAGDRVVVTYDKITRFRDHYRLTLVEAPPVDVRVLFALAITLDALQRR